MPDPLAGFDGRARAVGLIPALAGLAFVGLAVAPALAQGLVERSVLVTVLDEDDVAIRDLTGADFSLRENGVARAVTGVRRVVEPLYVTILVDLTQPRAGTSAPVTELRAGIAGFIDAVRAGDPEAKIAIVEVSGSAVMTSGFDASPDALDRRVRRLFPTQQAGGVMLEALVEAGRLLGETPSPRRAIVCIERDSIEHSTLRPDLVGTSVLKAGAAVWVVSLRGDGGSSLARELVLDQLPGLSGGLRLTTLVSSPIESMLRKVGRALTTQYELTYRSDAPSVETVQPRVQVGARMLVSPWVR
jgi:hypothetical protein